MAIRDYWLMADPLKNYQFNRGWTEPPPRRKNPRRKNPAPLAGGARADQPRRHNSATLTERGSSAQMPIGHRTARHFTLIIMRRRRVTPRGRR
jgi:hypothetical protein